MAANVGSLRVLGFEPFDDGSHRSVRELISHHSAHHWVWFTRPGRGWKWRMRLAAVELVESARAAGGLDEPIDAIFATSMLGAADLRALLPDGLRRVPLILYMHENQAAYPVSAHPKAGGERDVHFALTNLTSILAADSVIWNSRWNQQSFLEGMHSILRRASAVRLGDWSSRIEDRSRVIWPPVEPPPSDLGQTSPPKAVVRGESGVLHNPIRVVWPHRWEHDKGPDELLDIATRLSEPLNLRWTILGWEFPTAPEALVQFKRRFEERIDHIGFEADRSRYWEHLARCDWVLSTARHEFFGIAVVEALLAGCLPWLPNRLSYPELLPLVAHGLSPKCPPSDPVRLRQAILTHLDAALAPNAVARIDQAIEQVAAGSVIHDR